MLLFNLYTGNDNYKNSYFLLELNTKNKINLIENYSNIDVYQKCIFDENEIIVEGEELLARCLLHEIDHLDGIMYVDKVEGKLLDTEMEDEE